MPKYLKANSTGKIGVNFVKDVVDKHNSIFTEIPNQNDVGIDGIIELVENEETTGVLISCQIKSGKSYFDKKKRICKIPVGDHFDYWLKYPLPLIGIVYVPEEKKGFWIDIKSYFEEFGKCSEIKMRPNKVNEFDEFNFRNILSKLFLNRIPSLNFYQTLDLCNSNIPQEVEIGIKVGFWRYGDKNEIWEHFVKVLAKNKLEDIPYYLLYYFGFVVDWADVFLGRDKVTKENKNYVKEKLSELNENTIIKLLSLIDDENLIQRGSIGHFVERIISNIPMIDLRLEEIIRDNSIDTNVRETACWIYASHKQLNSIKFFSEIFESSNIQKELRRLTNVLKEQEAIYFYS